MEKMKCDGDSLFSASHASDSSLDHLIELEISSLLGESSSDTLSVHTVEPSL